MSSAKNNQENPVVRHHPVELRFALNGLRYALNSQPNFQVHCLCSLVVIGLGWYFKLSLLEWVSIALAISVVVTFELINTALETVVDLITEDYHPKAKLAKDLAASAVLASSLGALVVGLIIFLPRFTSFF